MYGFAGRALGLAYADLIAVKKLVCYACERGLGIRQHTSAYVSIRQHTSACVCLRQHASAYVSIRQHAKRSFHMRASEADAVLMYDVC